MVFYTNSNSSTLLQKAGLIYELRDILRQGFNRLLGTIEYQIVADERESKVLLTPIGLELSKYQATEEVVKSWISPLGCYLVSQHYACFINKHSLSESQYRCICRLLIW